jgi:hypothetical protein
MGLSSILSSLDRRSLVRFSTVAALRMLAFSLSSSLPSAHAMVIRIARISVQASTRDRES